MGIQVRCPGCGVALDAPAESQGRQVSCTTCGRTFALPAAAATPTAAGAPFAGTAAPAAPGTQRFCRQCGKPVAEQAAVCLACGCPPQAGTNFCPVCAANTNPAAVLCLKCGSQLAPAKGNKSKLVAGLLGIFLGWLGIHNFYLGYTGKAVTQLVLYLAGAATACFVVGFFAIAAVHIWGLIEGIMILAGSINKDASGQALKD